MSWHPARVRRSGTFFCVDKSVTAVVIQGLAEHKDTLGAPLCPCRHYDDKEAEAAQGFWNCPCVPMRERKVRCGASMRCASMRTGAMRVSDECVAQAQRAARGGREGSQARTPHRTRTHTLCWRPAVHVHMVWRGAARTAFPYVCAAAR